MYAASTIPVNGKSTVQIGPMNGADDAFMAVDCGEVSLVRLCLAAGQPLFEAGGRAASFYVLMRGKVEIAFGDRGTTRSASLDKPGTMFIFSCGDTHVARCRAADACEVVRIERKCLEQLKQLRPALRTLLQAVHAGELSLILSALRPGELAKPGAEEAAAAIDGTRTAPGYPAVGAQASRWVSGAVASWRRTRLSPRQAHALT